MSTGGCKNSPCEGQGGSWNRHIKRCSPSRGKVLLRSLHRASGKAAAQNGRQNCCLGVLEAFVFPLNWWWDFRVTLACTVECSFPHIPCQQAREQDIAEKSPSLRKPSATTTRTQSTGRSAMHCLGIVTATTVLVEVHADTNSHQSIAGFVPQTGILFCLSTSHL